MEFKYDLDIHTSTVSNTLKKITNQIYKLLPSREQGVNWELPLQTIIVELAGFKSLSQESEEILFPLICKLEGLFILTKEEDFLLFRRTIFECLNLMGELSKKWVD